MFNLIVINLITKHLINLGYKMIHQNGGFTYIQYFKHISLNKIVISNLLFRYKSLWSAQHWGNIWQD